MRIKVCGLREKENIKRISALGPDYIGLIFYKQSPRYAGEILMPEYLYSLDDRTRKVGVFVNEKVDIIIETVNMYGLDAVQLHGNETVNYCDSLKGKDIEVIKAFYPAGDTSFSQLNRYKEVCDYFLFDNRGDTGGGSGKKFNWELLSNYSLEKPYFLSGGIGPSDVENIIKITDSYLHAIDINSKFETEPGLKDVKLVSEFINELGIKQ